MPVIEYFAILFCLIAVLIAIKGLLKVVIKGQIKIDLFADTIINLISSGNLDQAINLCKAAPNALFVQGVLGVLNAANAGERNRTALENAFDSAYFRQNEKLALPKVYLSNKMIITRITGLDRLIFKELLYIIISVTLVLLAAAIGHYFEFKKQQFLDKWGLYGALFSSPEGMFGIPFIPINYPYFLAGVVCIAVMTAVTLFKIRFSAREALPKILDTVEKISV